MLQNFNMYIMNIFISYLFFFFVHYIHYTVLKFPFTLFAMMTMMIFYSYFISVGFWNAFGMIHQFNRQQLKGILATILAKLLKNVVYIITDM